MPYFFIFMSEDKYEPYIKEHDRMILRDYLAVDRTMLTNETSFMSYVRTSLTLIAAGATLVKFFDGNPLFQVFGWGLVLIGGWLVIHGYNRYTQVDEVLHRIRGDMNEAQSRNNGKFLSAARKALHKL